MRGKGTSGPIGADAGRNAPSFVAANIKLGVWARVSRHLTIDRMLAASGVFAACCSVAFASIMLTGAGHFPHVIGEEYLSIFTKPRGPVQPDADAPSRMADAATASAEKGNFDLTPTGSISSPSSAISSVSESEPGQPRLVSVSSGGAWFQNSSGFYQAKPGDTLPRLGRIRSIKRQNGQWIVLLENGAALMTDQSSAPANKRFARPMIFGP